MEVNELDDAITAFEHARVLAPQRADTYFNLGLCGRKSSRQHQKSEKESQFHRSFV